MTNVARFARRRIYFQEHFGLWLWQTWLALLAEGSIFKSTLDLDFDNHSFTCESIIFRVHFWSNVAISGHIIVTSGSFADTSGLFLIISGSFLVKYGHFRSYYGHFRFISGHFRFTSGYWSTLILWSTTEKCLLLWVFVPQSWVASNSLRGHGGQRSIA